MTHKKLKKTIPVRLRTTLSRIKLCGSARGCSKSIKNYSIKKRMARILSYLAKAIMSQFVPRRVA